VEHVADDAHLDSLELAEIVAQRQEVEQPLRRMLVRAVSRVDHVRVDSLGEELRGARRAVADHDHVDAQASRFPRRVDERLPLRNARAGGRHVHGVRRETFFSKLE